MSSTKRQTFIDYYEAELVDREAALAKLVKEGREDDAMVAKFYIANVRDMLGVLRKKQQEGEAQSS